MNEIQKYENAPIDPTVGKEQLNEDLDTYSVYVNNCNAQLSLPFKAFLKTTFKDKSTYDKWREDGNSLFINNFQ